MLTKIDHFAPVALDELNAVAALQTRVDRKYVVGADAVDVMLRSLDRETRVLDIDGRRRFGYESMYFDTPELTSYHLAARRRPSRFKVRTRNYVDAGECMLEVKLRNPRRETVKHRLEYGTERRDRLDDAAVEFLDGFEVLAPVRLSLRPTLMTRYVRTTLLSGGSRTTLDVDVTCRRPDLDAPSACFRGRVIVETKSCGAIGPVDRVLWSLGVRPVVVSKYATGLAALRPELPRNKWHRTLARHVELDA